jgi:hypothetical protein
LSSHRADQLKKFDYKTIAKTPKNQKINQKIRNLCRHPPGPPPTRASSKSSQTQQAAPTCIAPPERCTCPLTFIQIMAARNLLEVADLRRVLAEHRSGQAYPRIVWLAVLGELESHGCNTLADFVLIEPAVAGAVALNIGVSATFVKKVADSYSSSRLTGSKFGPKVRRQSRGTWALQPEDKRYIISLLRASAGQGVSQSIESLRRRLWQDRGVRVSYGTIQHFLSREMRWSRKKASKTVGLIG